VENKTKKIITAGNSGLAKGGVSCFVETFVQGSTFVLRMNFSAKNPALRQAANRWQPAYLSNFWADRIERNLRIPDKFFLDKFISGF
jgi:hypothetical protein